MDTKVSKNVLYASLSTLLPSIFTFVFWLTTARVAGAEAIGIVSAISSFVIIIATIDVLDMSLGMKRYLGIAISSGDLGRFKQILTSTVLCVSIIIIISSFLIALPDLRILEIINIDRQYVWIIIPMIPALAFQYVFSEALITALQSKKLISPLLIGALARFPVLFGVIYFFNTTDLGSLLSYSVFLFISTSCYFVYLFKICRKTTLRATENFRSNAKEILKAGLASWFPHIISVLGSQVAIISVFSLEGSVEGGMFYLPMAIYTVSLFIVAGINRVGHPLVAGMKTKEQQTAFLSYSVKLAFLLTMPIVVPLLFFPGDFLSLLGSEFRSASLILTIFIVGVPFTIISEMVFYFVYGRGDNKTVLVIGLAGNVPRLVLYFLLIPVFGSDGAAIAYLVGSLGALVLSVKTIKAHSLVINYRDCIVLSLVPIAIGTVTWVVDLQFVISAAIILVGSLVAYIKLRLFTDGELYKMLYTGLPQKVADRTYPTLSKIMYMIR